MIRFPTACIKWVLPKPTPPDMNKGLYAFPGLLDTCKAAALASWFDLPSTKESKLSSALRPEFCEGLLTEVFCVGSSLVTFAGVIFCNGTLPMNKLTSQSFSEEDKTMSFIRSKCLSLTQSKTNWLGANISNLSCFSRA